MTPPTNIPISSHAAVTFFGLNGFFFLLHCTSVVVRSPDGLHPITRPAWFDVAPEHRRAENSNMSRDLHTGVCSASNECTFGSVDWF